jgi:TrpR-related protein YerC/YecD
MPRRRQYRSKYAAREKFPAPNYSAAKGDVVLMNENLHADGSEAFYKTVLKLRGEDECRRFFEDICSLRELKTIEQRFSLLYLLSLGKSYAEIEKATGASSATISRAMRIITGGESDIEDIINR